MLGPSNRHVDGTLLKCTKILPFVRLTHNDKIKYDEISALFLLNHLDFKEHSFVISLREDKSVIQGNQRY